MSRIRLILPALAAVLVVSAAIAACALATTPTYFVEGKEITGAEKYAITFTLGTAHMNTEIGGVKMHIECTSNKLFGENYFEAGGRAKDEADFNNCALYEISKTGEQANRSEKCEIKTPIEFKYAEQLVAGPGGLPEDEYKPASGEVFVEVVLQDAPGSFCLFDSRLQVTGAYDASYGPEAEIERREHEMWFQSAGSKLKIGTTIKASFTMRVTGLKLKKLTGETLSKRFRAYAES
jgi:hypothetical protein